MPSLSLLRFRMQERGNAVLRLRHCDAETQIERTSFLSALKPPQAGSWQCHHSNLQSKTYNLKWYSAFRIRNNCPQLHVYIHDDRVDG